MIQITSLVKTVLGCLHSSYSRGLKGAFKQCRLSTLTTERQLMTLGKSGFHSKPCLWTDTVFTVCPSHFWPYLLDFLRSVQFLSLFHWFIVPSPASCPISSILIPILLSLNSQFLSLLSLVLIQDFSFLYFDLCQNYCPSVVLIPFSHLFSTCSQSQSLLFSLSGFS